MNVFFLVLGGSLGTLARHYGSERLSELTGSPASAILVINVAGSFAIGLVLSLAAHRFDWPAGLVLLVAVGFLGALTTFSTFTWQTLQYLEARDIATATLNVAVSVTLGMLAVYAGSQLGRVGA